MLDRDLRGDALVPELDALDRWLADVDLGELRTASRRFVQQVTEDLEHELTLAAEVRDLETALVTIALVADRDWRLELPGGLPDRAHAAVVGLVPEFDAAVDALPWLASLGDVLSRVPGGGFRDSLVEAPADVYRRFARETEDRDTLSSRLGLLLSWAEVPRGRGLGPIGPRLDRELWPLRTAVESEAGAEDEVRSMVGLRKRLLRFVKDFPDDALIDLPEPGATVAWAQALADELERAIDERVQVVFTQVEDALERKSGKVAKKLVDDVIDAVPDDSDYGLHASLLLAEATRLGGEMKNMTSAIQLSGNAAHVIGKGRADGRPDRLRDIQAAAHFVRGAARCERGHLFIEQAERAARRQDARSVRDAWGSFEADFLGAVDDKASLSMMLTDGPLNGGALVSRGRTIERLDGALRELARHRDRIRPLVERYL